MLRYRDLGVLVPMVCVYGKQPLRQLEGNRALVRLVLTRACVIPVTCIHSIAAWSESEAVHCGLAALSSLGMIWPACVLLVPPAICWPWISHAVGCK